MATKKQVKTKQQSDQSAQPAAPSPLDPARLRTVADAARAFGVSDETIRRWVRKGIIGYVMVGPYRIKRIPDSEIDRLTVTVDGAAN